MAYKTLEQNKAAFAKGTTPSDTDFSDLIESCQNEGFTGNITLGKYNLSIENGIIKTATLADVTDIIIANVTNTHDPTLFVELDVNEELYGKYYFIDEIFNDNVVYKQYINLTTKHRFIAYKAEDDNYYWQLVLRGWSGDSLTDQPGLFTKYKSKPFATFTDLTALKGNWEAYFTDIDDTTKKNWKIS